MGQLWCEGGREREDDMQQRASGQNWTRSCYCKDTAPEHGVPAPPGEHVHTHKFFATLPITPACYSLFAFVWRSALCHVLLLWLVVGLLNCAQRHFHLQQVTTPFWCWKVNRKVPETFVKWSRDADYRKWMNEWIKLCCYEILVWLTTQITKDCFVNFWFDCNS